MRVDAFVPRMNEALEAARALGLTVVRCPSDVVDKPLVIADTTHLRAAAFRDGRGVCLESEGSFACDCPSA